MRCVVSRVASSKLRDLFYVLSMLGTIPRVNIKTVNSRVRPAISRHSFEQSNHCAAAVGDLP